MEEASLIFLIIHESKYKWTLKDFMFYSETPVDDGC